MPVRDAEEGKIKNTRDRLEIEKLEQLMRQQKGRLVTTDTFFVLRS